MSRHKMSKRTAVAEVRQNSAPILASVSQEVDSPIGRVRRKLVTLPQLKLEDDHTIYVKIISSIRVGREIKGGKLGSDGKPMKPADLMDVADLTTGQCATVVMGVVLRDILTEQYPEDSYVNKAFEITPHKVAGKRWKAYSVAELELPA